MFENCTYSVFCPFFGDKKKDENVRYRASFGIKPRLGEHMAVFEGKSFSRQDIYPRSVVVKSFRHYSGNTQDCRMYKICSEKGGVVAECFNKLLDKKSFKVHFLVPAITEVEQRATITCWRKFERDEAVVFEEKIKGAFVTFVDKRCKTLECHTDSLILEAFCHFSLYASGGKFVICGLKGVQRKDLHKYILTNPTIHSREGKFGPKDKRDAGIEDFKVNHTCNEFCQLFINKPFSEFDKGSDEC